MSKINTSLRNLCILRFAKRIYIYSPSKNSSVVFRAASTRRFHQTGRSCSYIIKMINRRYVLQEYTCSFDHKDAIMTIMTCNFSYWRHNDVNERHARVRRRYVSFEGNDLKMLKIGRCKKRVWPRKKRPSQNIPAASVVTRHTRACNMIDDPNTMYSSNPE